MNIWIPDRSILFLKREVAGSTGRSLLTENLFVAIANQNRNCYGSFISRNE